MMAGTQGAAAEAQLMPEMRLDPEQFRDFIVPYMFLRVTLLPDHLPTLVCDLICF